MRAAADVHGLSGMVIRAAMANQEQFPGGVVHDLPTDLAAALARDGQALLTWQDITPLARNEWICWIESATQAETRQKRVEWGRSNLRDGKRRPCCWPGCPHREPGSVSASKRPGPPSSAADF